MQKPILNLLSEPINGVIGKFLIDNSEYFKGIEADLYKSGVSTHLNGGYFNGYVIVQPEHPFYEKNYDEINDLLDKKGIYIHGGLTFSDGNKNFCPELSKDHSNYWVFGFDTRHAGDTAEYWTEERTWEETNKLLKAAINYKE